MSFCSVRDSEEPSESGSWAGGVPSEATSESAIPAGIKRVGTHVTALTEITIGGLLELLLHMGVKSLSTHGENMLAMPELRACLVNPGKTLNLGSRVNVESVLMQCVGEEAPEPCARCKSGSGPYRGCYIVPGVAGGACGNCQYSCAGTRCLYNKTNLGRRQSGEHLRSPVTRAQEHLQADSQSDRPKRPRVAPPEPMKEDQSPKKRPRTSETQGSRASRGPEGEPLADLTPDPSREPRPSKVVTLKVPSPTMVARLPAIAQSSSRTMKVAVPAGITSKEVRAIAQLMGNNRQLLWIFQEADGGRSRELLRAIEEALEQFASSPAAL